MDQPENRVALIELLGRDGRVQHSVDVMRWPVTLGRSRTNTVVPNRTTPVSAGVPATTAVCKVCWR